MGKQKRNARACKRPAVHWQEFPDLTRQCLGSIFQTVQEAQHLTRTRTADNPNPDACPHRSARRRRLPDLPFLRPLLILRLSTLDSAPPNRDLRLHRLERRRPHERRYPRTRLFPSPPPSLQRSSSRRTRSVYSPSQQSLLLLSPHHNPHRAGCGQYGAAPFRLYY